MVLFDLPTGDIKARKAYTRFRKGLLRNGFDMMQYSVYIRHCASGENAEVHAQRIKSMLPEKRMVSIITITDKQFGDIKNFWGRRRKKNRTPASATGDVLMKKSPPTSDNQRSKGHFSSCPIWSFAFKIAELQTRKCSRPKPESNSQLGGQRMCRCL